MNNAILFLLDRSGSMNVIKENTIMLFNDYLSKMRDVADLTWTFIQFDTQSTDVIESRIAIKDAKELTNETFEPRGGTPLIDALAVTIKKAKESYAPTDRVIIVTLTDGEENSSREYKLADVLDLIKECAGWGWQFVFLGASIDAYGDAGRLGIGQASTMSYDSHNTEATLSASASNSVQARGYFATGQSINFSAEDKAKAGDAFVSKSQQRRHEAIKKAIDSTVKPDVPAAPAKDAKPRQTLVDDITI